ncbi:MAG: DUF551 domain-containing protein [Flavobacteriales bacterium]|nr:DUF551 domain-containing protein [Flavobacteriales bacterium]MBP6642270.1 DUF551 domain-containing protein [Flavobacteriales bacterium]MBP7154660.1 DUF551 domain-containing protein [Flavobacteriales bacterium]HQV73897.1 DUF551 domain-containing protein [Flavobacteriales bacterium]HQW39769.1 DUF551 domain-containing protein [Flavobacteriales bacterium]
MGQWIPISQQLPEHGSRVLCHLPNNTVFLPGKTGATEERNVVVLRFAKDFFLTNPSRTGHTGPPHFWLGEGTSNKFFTDVTHWMPLPEVPSV